MATRRRQLLQKQQQRQIQKSIQKQRSKQKQKQNPFVNQQKKGSKVINNNNNNINPVNNNTLKNNLNKNLRQIQHHHNQPNHQEIYQRSLTFKSNGKQYLINTCKFRVAHILPQDQQKSLKIQKIQRSTRGNTKKQQQDQYQKIDNVYKQKNINDGLGSVSNNLKQKNANKMQQQELNQNKHQMQYQHCLQVKQKNENQLSKINNNNINNCQQQQEQHQQEQQQQEYQQQQSKQQQQEQINNISYINNRYNNNTNKNIQQAPTSRYGLKSTIHDGYLYTFSGNKINDQRDQNLYAMNLINQKWVKIQSFDYSQIGNNLNKNKTNNNNNNNQSILIQQQDNNVFNKPFKLQNIIIPLPRDQYGITAHDNDIYIYGGCDYQQAKQIDDLIKYNPLKSQWTKIKIMGKNNINFNSIAGFNSNSNNFITQFIGGIGGISGDSSINSQKKILSHSAHNQLLNLTSNLNPYQSKSEARKNRQLKENLQKLSVVPSYRDPGLFFSVNNQFIFLYGGMNIKKEQVYNDAYILRTNCGRYRWDQLQIINKPYTRFGMNYAKCGNRYFMFGGQGTISENIVFFNDLYEILIDEVKLKVTFMKLKIKNFKDDSQLLNLNQNQQSSQSIANQKQDNQKQNMIENGSQQQNAMDKKNYKKDAQSSQMLKQINENIQNYGPVARGYHGMTGMGKRYVLIVGGQTYQKQFIQNHSQKETKKSNKKKISAQNSNILNDIWAYDIYEMKWMNIEPKNGMIKPTHSFAISGFQNKVFIFGGIINNKGSLSKQTIMIQFAEKNIENYIVCSKCQEKRKKSMAEVFQNKINPSFSVGFIYNFSTEIKYPFQAFTLLIDAAKLFEAQSIRISKQKTSEENQYQYVHIQYEGKPITEEQFHDMVIGFSNKRQISKKIKSFSNALKYGGFRIGKTILFISVDQQTKLRKVFLLSADSMLIPNLQQSYEYYHYTQNIQTGNIQKYNGRSSKQIIFGLLQTHISLNKVQQILSNEKRAQIFIFSTTIIMNDQKTYFHEMVSYNKPQDILLHRSSKQVQFFKSINMPIQLHPQLSLVSYLKLYELYPKTKIYINNMQEPLQMISYQKILRGLQQSNKINKIQLKDIKSLKNVKTFIFQLELYEVIEKNFIPELQGVLVYYNNRMINRMQCNFGSLFYQKFYKKKYRSKFQNIWNIVGYINITSISNINPAQIVTHPRAKRVDPVLSPSNPSYNINLRSSHLSLSQKLKPNIFLTDLMKNNPQYQRLKKEIMILIQQKQDQKEIEYVKHLEESFQEKQKIVKKIKPNEQIL